MIAAMALIYAAGRYYGEPDTERGSAATAAEPRLPTPLQMPAPEPAPPMQAQSAEPPVILALRAAYPVQAHLPLYGRRPNNDYRLIDFDEVRWLQERLDQTHAAPVEPGTLTVAMALSKELSGMRYATRNEGWVDPSVTDQRRWGDCAAKSYWLATRLIEAGYTGVGIVQGVPRNYVAGQSGHAWVEIQFHGNRFVFEPTVGPNIYIPETAPTKNYEVIVKVFRRSVSAPPAQAVQ